MRLPELAVKNHHFTLMVVIIFIILGVNSFLTMPRSEDPQISVPGVSILVVFPGANPVDMERLITDPIEKAVNELTNIERLESISFNGIASVSIKFDYSATADDKYSEVVDKVNSIRSDLPEGISLLDISKWEVGTVNVFQLALISDNASYRELHAYSEELEDRISKVSGVRKVDIWACPDEEVTVALDFERMAMMNISLNHVLAAIQSSNANIPGGSLDLEERRFNVRTSGSYESLDDIRNTIVSWGNGKIVHLKDIASVYQGYETKDYTARVNTRRAVFLTFSQKNKTNIFLIVEQVKKIVREFEKDLPPSIKTYAIFDQSKSVAGRFNLFFSNLIQGIFLVGLLVFLGVGLRAAFVVMMAIPASLFIGLSLVNFSGFGLEQISIAGLVIVLGILVDNAIVVTENVARYMDMGFSPFEASYKAASEVGWAIVSATATTIAAFIPIILMQDDAGAFIRSLPVTVSFALAASLFIALTFTPYLSSKFLKVVKSAKINWFQRKLNKFISTVYRRVLHWCLHHTRTVILSAVGLFIFSLLVFLLVGVSFFPKAEKPQFMINIRTPVGSSIKETDRAVRFVEQKLLEHPQIEHFAANIGRGNPRIYYNVFSENEKSNYAQIFVELKEFNLKSMQKLLTEMRTEFSDFSGGSIEVKELEQGPPLSAPIEIIAIAKRIEDLDTISRRIENVLLSADGTINVNNPLKTSNTDLRFAINREKAGLLGVPLIDIDRTIRTAVAGLKVSSFRDASGQDFDIVMRLNSSTATNKITRTDLSRIFITSLSGAFIPLEQLAPLEFTTAPLQISHYNLDRSASISADVREGYSTATLTSQILEKLEQQKNQWPKGTYYKAGGELRSREESFGGMQLATVIAMIVIFGILVLQFRSFTQPFIIFASLPLALIGSVFALFLTDNSFSFTAFIGLISLAGIVVNDAIILVDYTNQLRRAGTGLVDALKQAGEIRFTSIFMTSSTTMGGLLPLTLQGGTLWAPLGWTIIGGLFTSTALTLIMIPVLYKVLARFQKLV